MECQHANRPVSLRSQVIRWPVKAIRMENFGIILSVPGAFITSILYSAILGKVTNRLPKLIPPLKLGSVVVLLAAVMETIATTTIGPNRLQQMTGSLYYPFHVVVFLLTLPALSGIMRFQNRFKKLSKWYSVGGFCAVVGLLIVLQQYVVSEAIFGVDGVGGPYGKP